MVGIGLMVLGAALAAGGLGSLGRNLRVVPYPPDDGVLVVRGAYRIVRHPIYGGLVLGAFGWSLYLHSWVVMGYALALLVLFDLKSRREEVWLLEKYPDYAEYRARTDKLIPWLY